MKNVLIIDDTKNIRLMLTKCLELEGYDVTTANDGKEAIELFRTKKFDLAFLDIKLPEIRGTEVLKRIREMGVDTPVIIITAYGTVKNAVECTHMGAVAYVQKPFSAEKIKSILQELYPNLSTDNNSNNIDKYLSQADGLIGQNMFNEAIIILKKAISFEPANAEVMHLFSKAYEGMGNLDYADKFYKSYLLFSGK